MYDFYNKVAAMKLQSLTNNLTIKQYDNSFSHIYKELSIAC